MATPVRVGVTSGRKGDELAAAFARSGASVLHGATVGGDRVADDVELTEMVDRLLADPPHFFAASTGKGMRVLADAADRTGRRDRLMHLLDDATVVARGAKAVGGLGRLGISPEWVAPDELDSEVVEWIGKHADAGQRVAVQLHGAPSHPYGRLETFGLTVVALHPYASVLPEDPAPGRRLIDAIVARELDVVTFTSPGAVHGLDDLARDAGLDEEVRRALSGEIAVAVVGPVTHAAAEHVGYVAKIEPDMHRSGALVRAVHTWWAKQVQRANRS